MVNSLRATDKEFAAWRFAADSAGQPFNTWARRALNEQAALETALAREEAASAARSDPRPLSD